MKKKLEAELISIAHRILQLKDKTTLSQLQEEARQLYEKLTILTFSESYFEGPQPTIGQIRSVLDTDFPKKTEEVEELQEIKVAEEEIKESLPVKILTEIKDPEPDIFSAPVQEQEEKVKNIIHQEDKPEIVIEEINARVTEDLFVPANSMSPESSYLKNDMEDVTPTAQDIFLSSKKDTNEKPKSLNDQLRKEIHIGLNDRLAFIKYLFDGSSTDYNRVLSQLSTFTSKKEAEAFIATMIKPDYNNWTGKEEYEDRFMGIVLSKFNS